MEEIKLNTKFEAFLKAKCAYGFYLRNVEDNYVNDNFSLNEALKEIQSFGEKYFFFAAFVFRKTPEGEEYWLKLDAEFQNLSYGKEK